MPFAVGYRELFRFQIASGKCLEIKRLKRHRGSEVKRYYETMTKRQNRWALQSNQRNQVWKGSNRVSGTLNEFREEGVKNLSQGA